MKRTVVIVLLMVLLLPGCRRTEISLEAIYNNDKPAEELITHYYSDSKMDRIWKGVNNRYKTLDYVANRLEIECVRKTESDYYQYYIVFLHESGLRSFLFINDKEQSSRMVTFDRIPSKSELDFVVADKTKRSEIESVVPDHSFLHYDLGIGAVELIVKEGVISMIYSGVAVDENGEYRLADEPIVCQFSFISNEEILKYGNSNPPILDIDKDW